MGDLRPESPPQAAAAAEPVRGSGSLSLKHTGHLDLSGQFPAFGADFYTFATNVLEVKISGGRIYGGSQSLAGPWTSDSKLKTGRPRGCLLSFSCMPI